jgi:hypothetical protein
VPWEAIAGLSALEELSLWNCGLGGPLLGPSLCKLHELRVLALSQNSLHGAVPECMDRLHKLKWLWLDVRVAFLLRIPCYELIVCCLAILTVG